METPGDRAPGLTDGQRAVMQSYAETLGADAPLDREYTAEQLENSPYRAVMEHLKGQPPVAIASEQLRHAAVTQEETEARARLAAQLAEAFRASESAAWDGPYTIVPEPDWDALAEKAVGVFAEWLRDPPVREHMSDGTERVRWPE